MFDENLDHEFISAYQKLEAVLARKIFSEDLDKIHQSDLLRLLAPLDLDVGFFTKLRRAQFFAKVVKKGPQPKPSRTKPRIDGMMLKRFGDIYRQRYNELMRQWNEPILRNGMPGSLLSLTEGEMKRLIQDVKVLRKTLKDAKRKPADPPRSKMVETLIE